MERAKNLKETTTMCIEGMIIYEEAQINLIYNHIEGKPQECTELLIFFHHYVLMDVYLAILCMIFIMLCVFILYEISFHSMLRVPFEHLARNNRLDN